MSAIIVLARVRIINVLSLPLSVPTGKKVVYHLYGMRVISVMQVTRVIRAISLSPPDRNVMYNIYVVQGERLRKDCL